MKFNYKQKQKKTMIHSYFQSDPQQRRIVERVSKKTKTLCTGVGVRKKQMGVSKDNHKYVKYKLI